MKQFRNLFFYLIIIGGFSTLIYWIVSIGSKLESADKIIKITHNKTQWNEFVDTLQSNLGHPLAILLAQIVTIILVARLFGWICKKIGQPTVVGEIIAGIILGPSLLGMYFPDFFSFLFPTHSLGNLQFLSQIGLILFMFIVGMEIDIKLLKNKANDAVVISSTSIIVPFALGMALAYFLYKSFAPIGIQFMPFGLFIGIAMSVTAFPVLARIVQERGIHKTRLGTIIITAAAVDDITAWSLLAAVIALVKAGSFLSSLYIIGCAVVYVLVMIKLVRPFLKRVGDLHASRENLSKSVFAIFILTLILSSWATEIIGIHALFGAFMAGAIMPENAKFRNTFIEKIEDIALVLLLPLFFVFTGLRTQIGLINDIYLWKITGLIILVAITGKFLGSALAARYVRQSWKDSLTIGALMNTRGLVELVILNIGYDLGVLTPEIFAMLVIMALVTTFLTGPSLDFINWAFNSKKKNAPQDIHEDINFKILISFARPESGRTLLCLAHSLIKKIKNQATITAMHLIPSDTIHRYNLEEYENTCFEPILEESHSINQPIITSFKITNDLDSDIITIANTGEYDLLLIGIGQSIYEGSFLGRLFGFSTQVLKTGRLFNKTTGKVNIFENSPFDERTKQIISNSKIQVGVLIDKGFRKTDSICIPIISTNDAYLIDFAKKMIFNAGSKITFVYFTDHVKFAEEIQEPIEAIKKNAPHSIAIITKQNITTELVKQYNALVISSESWKYLFETKSKWLNEFPSTLIVSDKK